MKKLAKNLTETEQILFTEHFSYISDLDESESPCPWACPWTWAENHLLEGKDIEECAENFYFLYEDDIKVLKEEEEEE